MQFEYRVVPAPSRGEKAKGVKTTADRFALTLTHAMNALAAEGWEYVRADALPCEERTGLTGTKSSVQHVLVFRRLVEEEDDVEAPDEDMPWVKAALGNAVRKTTLEPAGRDLDPVEEVEVATPRLGSARVNAEGHFPSLGGARRSRKDLSG